MNEELYNLLKEKGAAVPNTLEEFNVKVEENEDLKLALSEFIDKNNLNITLGSKKKNLFLESPSQEDSLDIESEEYSYLDNFFASFKRGWARGGAAEEATDVLNPLATVDYNHIAEQEKTIKRLEKNKSKVLQKFQEKGFGNLRFLRSAPELLGEVFGMMGRTIVSDKSLAAGAAGGAAVGASTLGLGALPAAFGSTLVASSYVSEFGSTVLDTIREQKNEDGSLKYDLSNEKDLIKAFSDKELMEEAKKNGQERGIPVAVLDALTMKATSSAIKLVKGTSRGAKFKQAVVGTSVESLGGATGETLAQVFDKGEIEDSQAIVLEGLLEVAGGSPVVVYNMYEAEQVNKIANKEIQQKIDKIEQLKELETDPNVLKELQSTYNELVLEKNKNNKEIADNITKENLLEVKKIKELNNKIEEKQEAIDVSVSEDTKKILEEDLKKINEEIVKRTAFIKNTKSKNKYYELGKKIKEEQPLTNKEQKFYEKNKEDIDNIYETIEQENKNIEEKQKKEYEENTSTEEEKSFINKIFDFSPISFLRKTSNNIYNDYQKLRKLNSLEEIKEGLVAEHKNYSVEKFNKLKKLLENVKDPNTKKDLDNNILNFVLQEEVNGKRYTQNDLKNFIDDANNNNQENIDSENLIEIAKNMMVDVQNLSQMMLDNQNYQKVFTKVAKDKNIARKKELQDTRVLMKNTKDKTEKQRLKEKIEELKIPYVSPLETIKSNLGTYLTRSYRFFSDRNFKFSQTKDEALKLAVDRFKSGLVTKFRMDNKRNPNENENLEIDQKASEKALEVLNDIEFYLTKQRSLLPQNINDGVSFENIDLIIDEKFTKQINKVYQDLGILKQRKEVDEFVRTFLGEYKDIGSRYLNSIDKMTKLIYDQTFYEGVLTTFDGSLISDTAKEGFVRFDVNTPTNPLKGKFLDKELHDSLVHVDDVTTKSPFYYFLNLMRKAKTVWNFPNSRKNITGNIFAMVQNGYFLKDGPGLSSTLLKFIKLSGTSIKTQDIPNNVKDLYKRASAQGLTNQSIGLNNLINDGSIVLDMLSNDQNQSKLVRDIASIPGRFDQKMKRFYGRVDDIAKMFAFEMETNQKSLQEFGVAYEQLTENQKKSIDKASAEKVKNTFPTWSRIPDWYKRGLSEVESDSKLKEYVKKGFNYTFTKKGVLGDFVPFKLETLRTYTNSLKEISKTGEKIKELNAQIKNETDSNKIELLNTRRSAYMKEYQRRIIGSISIGTSQAILKTAIPVLAFSSLKGLDTEEEQENKLKRDEQSYNAIRKFYPDWMDGHTLLMDFNNLKYNKEKDIYEVSTYDYSLENPYSLILDPIINVMKGDLQEEGFVGTLGEITDLIEPNMLVKAASEIVQGQDVYGRKLEGISDISLHIAKQVAPPSMIHFYRNLKDMSDQGVNLSKVVETGSEALLIRDYTFSPDLQFYFTLRDYSETKKENRNKEDLLNFRDMYVSSIAYSRNMNSNFVTKVREIINKSRLSKEEKEFILFGGGYDNINYEEEE